MAKILHFLILLLLYFNHSPLFAQIGTEGYYKDLFMDGGVGLYSKTSMTAVDSLNISMEYLATETESIQNQKMVSSAIDYNGALLYPDGSPRFRIIYTNGGSATDHGNSLDSAGRETLRTFYGNGGSYSGSCAGAFLTSISYQNTGTHEPYYHIWPGRTKTTGKLDIYTGHFVTPNSPLLQFYNYGGDQYISNVYHDGGCYAREDLDFPAQTEILLRYDYPGHHMDNKASCWAYKKNIASGRIVAIGSHPENAYSGERLDLMKAILQYAMQGTGNLKIKSVLNNGVPMIMNKSTVDQDPLHTKIGDHQYHHFKIEVPQNNSQISLTLNAQAGYHLNVYVNKNSYAFQSNALYSDRSDNTYKTLNISNLDAGTYYVSVECDTAVVTFQQSWGLEYIGNLAVLEGIAYSIEYVQTVGLEELEPKNQLSLFPNPVSNQLYFSFNSTSESSFSIEILNSLGQVIKSQNNLMLTDDCKKIDVSTLANGIYFLRVKNVDGNAFTKSFIKK